jgi:hyperosmotically inducible protein
MTRIAPDQVRWRSAGTFGWACPVCASEQMFHEYWRRMRHSISPSIGSIMKIKLAATCFVLGSLLVPALTHAADADANRADPLTFVKDSAITTKIKAKLADEKLSTLTHIKVDTDNKGQVVLSGTVNAQEAADKAVSIAHGTEGVTAVTSTIKVKKDI